MRVVERYGWFDQSPPVPLKALAFREQENCRRRCVVAYLVGRERKRNRMGKMILVWRWEAEGDGIVCRPPRVEQLEWGY